MDKIKYIEFEVSLAKIFVCNWTFLVFYVVLLAHQRAFEEHRPSQPSREHPLAPFIPGSAPAGCSSGRWWHEGGCWTWVQHRFLGGCHHPCECLASQLKGRQRGEYGHPRASKSCPGAIRQCSEDAESPRWSVQLSCPLVMGKSRLKRICLKTLLACSPFRFKTTQRNLLKGIISDWNVSNGDWRWRDDKALIP